ncbi:MAG: type 1 glutamine amidotransferase domain-containing protein [Gammaproteobacteria bacterium]|nr:type 1 glutamine amidotransferase domain-containing protein [Gammaproteobacteria bacterium]
MWKKLLVSLSILILGVFAFGFWFSSFLPDPEQKQLLAQTQAGDIEYIQNGLAQTRGRILAVVTSSSTMGNSDKKTGYELTELARAYYVFRANGFEVDIASPLGGQPAVVIDGDDMGAFDFAFLNDEVAQSKVNNSLSLADVSAQNYAAVYFVGGKGAMFDFPDNVLLKDIVRELYQSDAVIGAVCHGPAALLNVQLDDGSKLLANKEVSAFTNEEELFLIPDARNVFPFLLEEELIAQGANFSGGERYLEKVSVDGKLVTGQNPWSVWQVAESMIKQLGFEARPRQVTAEENSVDILSVYEEDGFSTALSHMRSILHTSESSVDKLLIAMHGLVSVMEWDFPKTLDLLRLLHHAAKGDVSAGRQNIHSSDFFSRIAFTSKYMSSGNYDIA